MKNIFIGLLLMQSIPSFAKTLKCEIKDSLKPPSWPKEYVLVEMGRYVSSLDFVHKISNDDGTFKDRIENLYSGLNRGGFTVTYCNPNDNEFIEPIGKINLYSQCAYGPNADKLFFDAQLNIKTDGSIKISLYSIDGNNIERMINVSACQ